MQKPRSDEQRALELQDGDWSGPNGLYRASRDAFRDCRKEWGAYVREQIVAVLERKLPAQTAYAVEVAIRGIKWE